MTTKKHNESDNDYHELQQELDGIIDKLQSGSIDIDEALASYSRGSEIIKLMQSRLTVAQNKVIKLQKNRKN